LQLDPILQLAGGVFEAVPVLGQEFVNHHVAGSRGGIQAIAPARAAERVARRGEILNAVSHRPGDRHGAGRRLSEGKTIAIRRDRRDT
jgi:hypothetical protein